jgi:hypothetical protein
MDDTLELVAHLTDYLSDLSMDSESIAGASLTKAGNALVTMHNGKTVLVSVTEV